MEAFLNFCQNNPGLTIIGMIFVYLIIDSIAGIFKKKKSEDEEDYQYETRRIQRNFKESKD